MDKWRRYVCLVLSSSCHGTYPLRRIGASSLFYPANQAKVTSTGATPPDEPPLPRPCISFKPSRSTFGKGLLDFYGFFGHGPKKTLLAAMDYRGVSLTYDVEDRVISDIANPQEHVSSESISICLGDALYVMDRSLIPDRHSCFNALTLGTPKYTLYNRPHWDWRRLEPPPFILEPGYKTTSVDAYTAVGGTSILISATGIGTYAFDTVSGSWSKAGDWELPFCGHAEFFPQCGVWVGFSAQDNRLCYLSSDLGGCMQNQPALDMVWDDPNSLLIWGDPNPKKYTRILKSQLVHLGSGRFCAASFFERVENELTEHGCIPQVETFTVLTGLVLKPGEFGRGIEMVPHKTLLYRVDLEGISNCWVF